MLRRLFAVVVFTALFGCSEGGGGSSGGAASSAPGSFSVRDAAGNADSTCLQITDGSALNGDSYNYTFTLGSDGSYNFYVSFYSGTAYEFGGTEIMSMEQGGTYKINAGNGSTNILTFTLTSDALLTVYGGSSPGDTWAGYLNASCGNPALTFNSSGTATLAVSGRTCARAASPSFSWPAFPAATESSQNLGVYTSSPHTLTIGKPAMWLPGSTSALPSQASLVFTYF